VKAQDGTNVKSPKLIGLSRKSVAFLVSGLGDSSFPQYTFIGNFASKN